MRPIDCSSFANASHKFNSLLLDYKYQTAEDDKDCSEQLINLAGLLKEKLDSFVKQVKEIQNDSKHDSSEDAPSRLEAH